MEEQIKQLQSEIENLKMEVGTLKGMIFKNQFSNLYVFDEQVKFRSALIFPTDTTSILTATTNSTGRVTIKDDAGNTRYIPYFS